MSSSIEATVEKKKVRTYKRDENGHLMCDQCDFKPKPTEKYPNGNPATLHYHIKSKHDGDFAHTCPVCQHGFLHKTTLDTHIVARHPEYDDKNNAVKAFVCPVDGCGFEALTKANRRIHFLRKHCGHAVREYIQETTVDSKKHYNCKCCNETLNSNTAFHYHIGKCLLDHNIQAHPQLALICE